MTDTLPLILTAIVCSGGPAFVIGHLLGTRKVGDEYERKLTKATERGDKYRDMFAEACTTADRLRDRNRDLSTQKRKLVDRLEDMMSKEALASVGRGE